MATAIIFIAAVVFIAVFIAILVARKRKPKFRISILLMFSGVAIALGGLSGFMRVMGQPEGNLGLSADMVICGLAVTVAGFVLVISSATKPK